MGSPPDLLHRAPRERADRFLLRELLHVAFETGDAAAFQQAIDGIALGEPAWNPKTFREPLFVRDLCEACFPVRVEGADHRPEAEHLTRVLETPPADARDVTLRQHILRELLHHPTARESLELVYNCLQHLRSCFEQSGYGPTSAVRRKLMILAAFKDVVDAMADRFEDSDSALGRLRDYAEGLRAQDTYGRLTELLDYDEHLATLDVRLRLGYDGRVRGVQLLAVRENRENTLIPPPLRRFFLRLWRLLRGYRFGEDEVLVRFVDEVFYAFRDDIADCLALVGHVEPYLAALGFRELAESKGLSVCLPDIVDPAEGQAAVHRRLEGVFNPLLLLQRITPVPCDVATDRYDAVVMLTGPNSGGKTRLLQAIALVQLLGQAGFFVPAAEARLVRAPTMFVSLVDEVVASQREGRLGSELLRIRQLFEQLEPGSLVVLDELCSGTNPSEGEVIFEMVVGLLPRLRPQVFISTHYLDLAGRLERERPIEALEFLQVELDGERRPTYRFVPGVATTSLAQQVAERLGVTREELAALVETKRSPDRPTDSPAADADAPGRAPEQPLHPDGPEGPRPAREPEQG